MRKISTDVLIVGAGAAGLFAALHLPEGTEVVVVDKGGRRHGSSFWAQGGIAAALGPEDSPELHAEDTARVAAEHADVAAVSVLCSEAPGCVLELAELGCEFDRDEDGNLHLAREGGQSVPRSAHAGDATGAAVMQTLRKAALPRVNRMEGVCLRLAVMDGRCVGAWLLSEGEMVEVHASSTVLGAGGVGGLFEATTNPDGATGDGVTLAWEAGAGLTDVEFIQFHPTALDTGRERQRPLLTEALRGAGAYVVDAEGNRFLFEHHPDGELAPRDVVARAISAQPSWLDCRHLGRELLESHFFSVVGACRERGLDPVTDLLPVTPAAHYFVGGISTDLDGRSSIPRLYAIGECASTGAHGANRLAGNSLAEALVFGRRAARAIAGQRLGVDKGMPVAPALHTTPVPVDHAWSRLRKVCSTNLGLQREAIGLHAVEDELAAWRGLPLTTRTEALELRSAATVATLIARGASLRTESRGGHYRSDHPAPDLNWAGVRLRLAWEGSDRR